MSVSRVVLQHPPGLRGREEGAGGSHQAAAGAVGLSDGPAEDNGTVGRSVPGCHHQVQGGAVQTEVRFRGEEFVHVKYDDLYRLEEWSVDKNMLSMMICVGWRSGVLIKTC